MTGIALRFAATEWAFIRWYYVIMDAANQVRLPDAALPSVVARSMRPIPPRGTRVINAAEREFLNRHSQQAVGALARWEWSERVSRWDRVGLYKHPITIVERILRIEPEVM